MSRALFRTRTAIPSLTQRRFQSQLKSCDPLRVLFCGSDEFSVASLRALLDEKKVNHGLFKSITTVTRRDKRVGPGLKQIRESRAENHISQLPESLIAPQRPWRLSPGANP